MFGEESLKRREFLKVSAAAVGVMGAPAILRSQNPNDIIGVGIIGTGGRAMGLIREALRTPKMEFRGVCDIWDMRMKAGLDACKNPGAATYTDYRYLLENKDIDAVILGTPDHWHPIQAIDAMSAGKDVYSEKCMGRSLEDGKAIKSAVKKYDRVYQLGHQLRSRKVNFRAKEIIESGALGKVTYVSLAHSRNKPGGKPSGRSWGWFLWGKEYVPTELTPDRLDWDRFLGPAPRRSWEPGRYLAWRCFWDYGTGVAGDLQSHLVDLTNQVLGLGIPERAYAAGQLAYWKDGREVPDVWQSVFEWPSRDLIVVYNCNFTNAHRGTQCHFFGTEGTMEFYSDIKVYGERGSHLYKEFFEKVQSGRTPSRPALDAPVPPVYEYKEEDLLASADHMQDFFDCIRTRSRTRCNEDVAFEEMVTTAMSIVSFQQKRQVYWDPEKEEIV